LINWFGCVSVNSFGDRTQEQRDFSVKGGFYGQSKDTDARRMLGNGQALPGDKNIFVGCLAKGLQKNDGKMGLMALAMDFP